MPERENHPEASDSSDDAAPSKDNQSPKLSYKFQRLRERLRAAIASGELVGKLPGERQLARRFRVNAKTLSKALTDLAAEGVLQRSIGRGTFVREPERRDAAVSLAPTASEHWLILSDDKMWAPVTDVLQGRAKSGRRNGSSDGGESAAALDATLGECDLAESLTDTRPSYLTRFTAVIDFCGTTEPRVTRELILRNLAVVNVDHVPRTFSTNAVIIDRVTAAANLARDLVFQGHRRILVVDGVDQHAGNGESKPANAKHSGGCAPDAEMDILFAVRQIAQRYDASNASVDASDTAGALAAVRSAGVTAILCASPAIAADVRNRLEAAKIAVPAAVSLVAVGMIADDHPPCTGIFVPASLVAEQIAPLARVGPHARRPTVIWLNGDYHDANTCAAPPGGTATSAARPSQSSRSAQ